MQMALKTGVDALFLCIFLCSVLSRCSGKSLGSSTDIYCLKSIKESLEDPHGYLKFSWNFNNNTEGFICKFPGVECCNPDENRVLNIRLSNMYLKGQFPRGIENCTSLTVLDLSDNKLQGTIPFDIGKKLPLVTSLDLSNNNFSGEIPSSITNCFHLNVLKLDYNKLTGHIPQEIAQLSGIKTFSVAGNLLSGPVPMFVNANIPCDSYANNTGLCGGPLGSCPQKRGKFNWKSHACVIVYVALAISAAAAVISYSVFWFYMWKRTKMTRRNNRRTEETQVVSLPDMELPTEERKEILMYEKFVSRTSFADINKATGSFGKQNMIGSGKMGTMYKARLPNGWFLAVKRFHYSQESKGNFVSELKILGRLRHDNLVPLLSFCIESEERLLVYKYISNGSLHDWLHSVEGNKKILEWPVRVKIAAGLGRGLSWLHHGCNFCVVHLHISSKSVLVDQNFEPKLSNFRRAKLINPDSSRSRTVDGESQEWDLIKKDVFNFGIVLLELVTGKDPNSSNKVNESLAEWVNDVSNNSSCEIGAIDKSLAGKGHDDEILQLLRVACNCVQRLPEQRPSMVDVYNAILAIGERYGLMDNSETSL